MATSEGIPSSIDIEFLELNDNPYGMMVAQRVGGPLAKVRFLQGRQVKTIPWCNW